MTKILLVEDDKSLREIYGVRLLAEGYDIVSAGDGEEALAMAIKERPQLIVSDVMMPKISGFDMLDILRSTTETKDIKVIMMTALSSEDQRERGESLGADRYLVKSQVGIEDVVRTVHEVLGDAPAAGASGNVFAQPPAPAAPRTPGTPGSVPPRPGAQAPASSAPTQPTAPQPAPTPPTPPAPSAPTPSPSPAPHPAPAQQPPKPAPYLQDPAQRPGGSPSASEPEAPSSQPPAGAPHTPPADTDNSDSNLPQPTAPFSTNRPAGLGDRIIHPIDNPDVKQDFSDLMAKELGAVDAAAPAPAPTTPTPPAPSAPTPSPSPAPQPAPAPANNAPSAPKPDLNFEETPRPPQNQNATPGAQPPQPQQ